VNIIISENHCLTCVQSNRPKPNVLAPRRGRNRPTSMVKNKITSVARVVGILYLLLSVLSTLQVLMTGFHEEWSYGQIRLGTPNPE